MYGVLNAKSGECPRCRHRIKPSKELFRKKLRCPQCGVLLYVSVTYLRTLFVLSFISGLTLVGLAIGIRNPVRLFVFGIPLGFLALTVIVRIAPHVRLPVFLLSDPEDFTSVITLGIVNVTGAKPPEPARRN
jgi:hypothetical protein